ncbi:MAG TPA: AAA family ATPase [Longimicrobium sp.]|nr:AAA family ATPase [Longimicrobium sp.]
MDEPPSCGRTDADTARNVLDLRRVRNDECTIFGNHNSRRGGKILMITNISFEHYKVLRDASIDLRRYNVVIGPNGSGKSTLLAALRLLGAGEAFPAAPMRSVAAQSEGRNLSIRMEIEGRRQNGSDEYVWKEASGIIQRFDSISNRWHMSWPAIRSVGTYSLDERVIAQPVELQPSMELGSNGGGLAGVLDRMRDENPEQFEGLNQEFARLLPEFDRILFETPGNGMRSLRLRLRSGHGVIKAADLSQGTLLALALLTIAYFPNPPAIIGIEEPDRGIHPRLYRDIQAALYRLAYPESFGISRKPVQVIVTTHSPFLLDLHRETPEEIIIAEKTADGAEFHRLTARPELAAILDEVSLGDAWYSGVLGGVPANR